MRRYGYPLAVIVLGSLVLWLVRTYAFFEFESTVLTILTALVLFLFGISLSNHHKNKNGWIKKFIVAALAIALLIVQLGLIKIEVISTILTKIGANSVIFYLFYIYFGYIFF